MMEVKKVYVGKNFTFLFRFDVLVLFLIILYDLIVNFPIFGFLVYVEAVDQIVFKVQSSEHTAVNFIGSLMVEI